MSSGVASSGEAFNASVHRHRYKNTGLDTQELRRRREEEGVQLRKQKRDTQLSKRRNLTDGCDGQEPDDTIEALQLIPAQMVDCVQLLNLLNNDNEVKANVLKTLSKVTIKDSPVFTMIQSVVANGPVLQSIISNFTSNVGEIVLRAIQIVANISSWGESYAQLIVEAKALDLFHILLTHWNSLVQKETVFTVSNIMAGNVSQIQAVIDANLIPQIIELLYMGDFNTQCEVCHVLLNISVIGSEEQLLYVLNMDKKVTNMDVIDAMASLLTAQDPKVIVTCVKFYNNVLVFAKRAKILNDIINQCEQTSMLFHFETLMNHSNPQIAVLVTHIMDEYFSGDTSFEEDMTFDTSLGEDDKQMEAIFSF